MLKIKQNRSRLEKIFGAKSFSWAWILNQISERDAAKKILLDLFSEEYDQTMKREVAYFRMGRNPLGQSQKIFQLLHPLCDSKEQAILNEKMRKIKVHLSNLPQSNIKT